MDNRRVHATRATTNGVREVVRYERSGKWYDEHTRSNATKYHLRTLLTLPEAIRLGKAVLASGGTVHFELPGGSRFDAGVRR